MEKCFKDYAANPNHPDWENISRRKKPLLTNPTDIRSVFDRDGNLTVN